MPPRRWTMGRRQPLIPELEHFLVSGCYYGGPSVDLDVFLLAGTIGRGRLTRLRELWAIHSPAVKARDGHGPVYAEVMLAGGTWLWPGAPWRCAAHREGRPAV